MQSFTVLDGLVAPMDRANVDTDLIIPKQFLKSIKRSGFGPNLFDELRYLDEGEPGQDCSKRPVWGRIGPGSVPRGLDGTTALDISCDATGRRHSPQGIVSPRLRLSSRRPMRTTRAPPSV